MQTALLLFIVSAPFWSLTTGQSEPEPYDIWRMLQIQDTWFLNSWSTESPAHVLLKKKTTKVRKVLSKETVLPWSDTDMQTFPAHCLTLPVQHRNNKVACWRLVQVNILPAAQLLVDFKHKTSWLVSKRRICSLNWEYFISRGSTFPLI